MRGDGLLDVLLCGLRKAQPDGPQRTRIILRLQRAQPRNDLPRPLEAVHGDLLVTETKTGDVQAAQFWHPRRMCAMPHNPDAIRGIRG